MCGIAGIASREPIPDPELVTAMRETMVHRGPDDAGTWVSTDRRVALAHRRLAIIDLSPAGHQPMADSTGRLRITFNGEIYNYQALRKDLEAMGHRFRTASDTEVILEAYREWGTECLSRLNGMFAFCLYDNDARRVFLARDRAGEKPLFYRHAGCKLVFASELKALMVDPAFPREIDPDALNDYLAYGYVMGHRCIFTGVCKLVQGQAMTFELDTDAFRTWRYWTLPAPVSRPNRDSAELLDELKRLFLDSVRLRMIADVPVGILLSGGMDSSLVTAMAAGISAKPVKTFTIAFPGYGILDEGPHARLVAEHFRTDHTELAAEMPGVELLSELARQYDEPIGDHSMIPTFLVSRLIRKHATVALGGDGGDELFGGYPHYNVIGRLSRYRNGVPAFARKLIGFSASRFLPVGTRWRNHLIGFKGDLHDGFAHVNMYFDAGSRRRLLSPAYRNGMKTGSPPESEKAGSCTAGGSRLYEATALDFRTTMVDGYLVKVDRASMMNSLEIRTPFLDHRLVEFAFRELPDEMRATPTARKVALRLLGKRHLPPGFDFNRKQGFELPLAHWLKGKWGGYMESVLEGSDPGLFDRRFLRNLVSAQRKGYANASRLFLLAIFELWRREYKAVLPSSSGAGGIARGEGACRTS